MGQTARGLRKDAFLPALRAQAAASEPSPSHQIRTDGGARRSASVWRSVQIDVKRRASQSATGSRSCPTIASPTSKFVE